MTVPIEYEPADDELLAYLLELLSAEDTERVELASITDDGGGRFVVETDLVDDYVRGALTGATLAQFESRYMASARRREGVRRASAFVRAIDRAAAQADSTTPSVSVPHAASAVIGDAIPFHPRRGSAWSTARGRGLPRSPPCCFLPAARQSSGTSMLPEAPPLRRSRAPAANGPEVSQQPSTPRESDPRSRYAASDWRRQTPTPRRRLPHHEPSARWPRRR